MNVQKGTASLTRINLIDVIRGIAIIGILLINIHFFEPSDTKSIEINTFDSKVINYIEMFSLNKFHFIFAFLFGVSTSIFINNLQKKVNHLGAYTSNGSFIYCWRIKFLIMGW